MFQSRSFPPSLLPSLYITFLFPALFLLSRANADRQRRHHGAAVRSFFILILAFPLCTYLITITGAPEAAITIQTRTRRQCSPHVSLPSYSSRRASFSNPAVFSAPFLSISLTRVLPCPSNCIAELLSARSWPVSHACQFSVDGHCSLSSSSLYCLDETFTLAAPILDTTPSMPSYASYSSPRVSVHLRSVVRYCPSQLLHTMTTYTSTYTS